MRRPARATPASAPSGSLKRSEFGMVKYVDMVGDMVDISIRTDAWR